MEVIIMAFTWSKDLETGNSTIDTQHKTLIDALNALMDACSQGKAKEQISETMKFLIDYTKRHFADEEKLQKMSGYPDYDNHKKMHDAFVQTVADIAKELDAQGPTIVMVGKVNNAVGNWLVTHIKREDAKVAAHIRSK